MNPSLSDPDLLDAVLETIAALVVVMDREGRVVRFNDACEELTGYDFEEMEGERIWELLIPEEDRQDVVEVFSELRAGNFPNRHENRWLTRDGERRIIDWSNSALIDDDGEVQLVIATGIDVTEQRRAEQHERELIRARAAQEAAEAARDSLRLSEELFSGIVDLCADAIISIDEDQRIVLFNQGAEEIFGYTADEAMGQPLGMLLPQGARKIHAAHIDAFADADKASRRMGQRQEIFGVRKNGESFPAEASISKQKIDGQWRFTAVVRDVTATKEAQKQLQRANDELARSNAELEQFATAASHDLQEPLRKIRAFGERLESRYGDDLPDRGRDYLDRMRNAAARMSSLVEDLLTLSRVTTRAKPFETVDLYEIIAEVKSTLEVRITRTDGQVQVREQLPEIDADPTQMRLLFQNLIGNGLKFHRDDVPPVVKISCESDPEASGDICRIVVEDNGIGFDEKYLDRLFDVFERLHGRGEYDGTGVGLAICKKIVERHDGSLDATSTPGAGSRFVISLPFEQLDKQATDE